MISFIIALEKTQLESRYHEEICTSNEIIDSIAHEFSVKQITVDTMNLGPKWWKFFGKKTQPTDQQQRLKGLNLYRVWVLKIACFEGSGYLGPPQKNRMDLSKVP